MMDKHGCIPKCSVSNTRCSTSAKVTIVTGQNHNGFAQDCMSHGLFICVQLSIDFQKCATTDLSTWRLCASI